MRRIAIVGCSGSGKSTLGRARAASLRCPCVELDAIFHQPGWTDLPADEFRSRVRDVVSGSVWVVDGNYSVIQDIVWSRADTVIWFDRPFATVMPRVVRRTLRRAILRTELSNSNREPWSNLFSLNPQKSIMAWTASRHGLCQRRHAGAQDHPKWAGLTVFWLTAIVAVHQLTDDRTNESMTEGAI